MNKIIEEILRNGFELIITYNSTTNEFECKIHGFYKSDYIRLIEIENEELKAISRYDETMNITCFDDLVYLNYEWWQSSKQRYEGWKSPDSRWLPFLIKNNLVKEETKIITNYI